MYFNSFFKQLEETALGRAVVFCFFLKKRIFSFVLLSTFRNFAEVTTHK